MTDPGAGRAVARPAFAESPCPPTKEDLAAAEGRSGMGAYRTAFTRPRARLGEQPETLHGSRLWLLPNPSGAQARYQLGDLVEAFGSLREAVR